MAIPRKKILNQIEIKKDELVGITNSVKAADKRLEIKVLRDVLLLDTSYGDYKK